ncbi:hypothetical protein D3C72_1882350 [compost metagenome]
MEGRLAPFGEGRIRMQIAARMAQVERMRERQVVDLHQPAAERLERPEGTGLDPAGKQHDDVGRAPRQPDRPCQRHRTHRVVRVGHEGDEGIARTGRGLGPDAVQQFRADHHDTDFSFLPSGSRLIVLAMSLVQAETAGTRERSTR